MAAILAEAGQDFFFDVHAKNYLVGYIQYDGLAKRLSPKSGDTG